jgi:hypothetical protein
VPRVLDGIIWKRPGDLAGIRIVVYSIGFTASMLTGGQGTTTYEEAEGLVTSLRRVVA